jgi:hypothetical protein
MEEDLLHFDRSAAFGDVKKPQDPVGRAEAYFSVTTVFWLSLMMIFSS